LGNGQHVSGANVATGWNEFHCAGPHVDQPNGIGYGECVGILDDNPANDHPTEYDHPTEHNATAINNDTTEYDDSPTVHNATERRVWGDGQLQQ
jgi:hypothetical protein